MGKGTSGPIRAFTAVLCTDFKRGSLESLVLVAYMSAPHEAIHKLPSQVLPTLVHTRVQDVEWGNALSSIQTETVSTCL